MLIRLKILSSEVHMTDNARFELFSFWRTSATYRVRVAFNFKGVRPTESNVNLDTGEQRGAAFLKINPIGGIPALIDHAPGQSATPISQSLAILEFLEFLEKTYSTPALLPADTHGRARVRSLAAMLAADVHPLITPQVKKYLFSTGKLDDAEQAGGCAGGLMPAAAETTEPPAPAHNAPAAYLVIAAPH